MDKSQNGQGAPQVPPQNDQASASYQINIMALISYMGPLCLIPFFTKDRDNFVDFHMRQGLVLFAAEIATLIFMAIVPILWFIGNLAGAIWFVLIIVGIVNVVRNEKKELPLLGALAAKLKI